jgi:nucleolar protein 15
MKKYFSQFGTVTRLRLSRNKKTGASKHYAFVEFASAEVADIVARTMDKYLLFNHILQCKVVPPENVHPELFKGANQRFKVVPRNKMAGAGMARGATREVWEKRVETENRRRSRRSKVLKEKMDYEYTAPTLKKVEDVPKKVPTLEDDLAQQLLTEAPIDETSVTVTSTELKPGQLTVTETTKIKKVKEKLKKDKKPKSDVVGDEPEEQASHLEEEAAPKAKKTKKVAKADITNEEEQSTASARELAPKPKKRKATAEGGDVKVTKTKKAKAKA